MDDLKTLPWGRFENQTIYEIISKILYLGGMEQRGPKRLAKQQEHHMARIAKIAPNTDGFQAFQPYLHAPPAMNLAHLHAPGMNLAHLHAPPGMNLAHLHAAPGMNLAHLHAPPSPK